MAMLDGLRVVFLEALSFADSASIKMLVKQWNEQCEEVYKYKEALIAEERAKHTTDVAPSSEVENYKKIAEYQQKLAMDRYFEINRLKKDVERWRRNLEAVLEERAEAKAEVAREIFEDLELFLNKAIDGWRKEIKFACNDRQSEMIDFRNDAFRYCLHEIAELKKKYTEGET